MRTHRGGRHIERWFAICVPLNVESKPPGMELGTERVARPTVRTSTFKRERVHVNHTSIKLFQEEVRKIIKEAGIKKQSFIFKRRPSTSRPNMIASESPREGDDVEAELSGAPNGPHSGSRLVKTPFSGS